MSHIELNFANKVLSTAMFGADIDINRRALKSIDVSGGGFTTDTNVGEQLADSIVTSVKKGHMAGPFKHSPLLNARFNQMFPLCQTDKVRMIVNMSFPPGASFNDCLDYDSLRKCNMASAPLVGELIRRCQGKATLSKYDMVAAYKLVPCKLTDIKLQGIKFLGRIFFELRQIFGAASAVSFYDDLHLLLVLLTTRRMKLYINKLFLPRVLDDLIHISTSNSLLHDFHTTYTDIASNLGIALQPFIGTKAYIEVDRGMALGLEFSSQNLTWSIPKAKQDKYTNKIHDVLEQTYVTLKMLQELNGCLNYLVAMSPILKFNRHHIIAEESRAKSAKNNQIIINSQARSQLVTWLRIINDKREFPLPQRHLIPPIGVLCILSDAAGRSLPSSDKKLSIGAAAVSYIDGDPNHIISACQAFFPESLVSYQTDSKQTRYGDKSNFLELLAILLGIIHNKELLIKNQVLLLSDSLPALWAIKKGRSPTCLFTSTITLAIVTILQSFECYYFLNHVPRLSSYAATVSDALTRDDPIGNIYAKIMKDKLNQGWPKQLKKWIENPTLDDTLGAKIYKEISGTFSWLN